MLQQTLPAHLVQMVHFALHRNVCRVLGIASASVNDRAQMVWGVGKERGREAVDEVLGRPDSRHVVWQISPLPLEGTEDYESMGADVVHGYLDELIAAFRVNMASQIWMASVEQSMGVAVGGPDYAGVARRETEVSQWLSEMSKSGAIVPPAFQSPPQGA